MNKLLPGPCSAFQSVNNFGNIFYPKEKRPGCALPFWIESVTKVVNRLKRTTWTRQVKGQNKFSLQDLNAFYQRSFN